MGSDIDTRKVVSSLTLFGHIARKLHGLEGLDAYHSVATVADDVLAAAASRDTRRVPIRSDAFAQGNESFQRSNG